VDNAPKIRPLSLSLSLFLSDQPMIPSPRCSLGGVMPSSIFCFVFFFYILSLYKRILGLYVRLQRFGPLVFLSPKENKWFWIRLFFTRLCFTEITIGIKLYIFRSIKSLCFLWSVTKYLFRVIVFTSHYHPLFIFIVFILIYFYQ
jgi:hypothetical protein